MSTGAFGKVSVWGRAAGGQGRALGAWLRVAVLAAVALCFVPTQGLALSTFEASSRVDASLLPRAEDSMVSTDGSPVNSHAAASALGRIGYADASVGGGHIGARASAFAENIGGTIHTVDSIGSGYFEVSIFTGSCMGMFTCGASSTSINLTLGGAFVTSDDGPVGANAESYVSVYLSLKQGGSTLFSQSGSAGAITVPGVTPPGNMMPWNNGTHNPPTGLFSGYTLNAPFSFQSGSFLLAPNSE